MIAIFLLALTTLLYAAYNILVKQSALQITISATSTITATITLQLAALSTSLVFAGFLKMQGGHSLWLPDSTYLWALAAGICIGGAEIVYFYLFAGIGGQTPMSVNVVVPTIVSGTIVLALLASWLLFDERLSWTQGLGSVLIISGIVLLFIRS